MPEGQVFGSSKASIALWLQCQCDGTTVFETEMPRTTTTENKKTLTHHCQTSATGQLPQKSRH